MKQLPCKINKCILYPTCRNKKVIDCEELRQMYYELKYRKGLNILETWEILNETLPKMLTVQGPMLFNYQYKEHVIPRAVNETEKGFYNGVSKDQKV